MAAQGAVVLIDQLPLLVITGYAIAGTASTGPTVPTTGQIWPRGQG